MKTYSRRRAMSGDELLEQLSAMQQLLYRLIGCQVNLHLVRFAYFVFLNGNIQSKWMIFVARRSGLSQLSCAICIGFSCERKLQDLLCYQWWDHTSRRYGIVISFLETSWLYSIKFKSFLIIQELNTIKIF